MYTFSIPVTILPNLPPENLIIPCYFCQAKLYKIPLAQRPTTRFTPHQLAFHLRLEVIHYSQHHNVNPNFYSHLPGQPIGVRANWSSFFPYLAQNWYTSIEFLASHLGDFALIEVAAHPQKFIYSTPMLRK